MNQAIPVLSLLPQMLNKSEKNSAWQEEMLDRFEVIAKNQLRQNLYLLDLRLV